MDFGKILHKAACDAFQSGIFVPNNDGKNTDWEIYLIKLGMSLAAQEPPTASDGEMRCDCGRVMSKPMCPVCDNDE